MAKLKRRASKLFGIALLLAVLNFQAWADLLPVVDYTATNLGNGFFEYDLVLDNPVTVPTSLTISGLVVVNGFSVFGLDSSSPIGAPDVNGTQWGFIAPIPPFADNLAYFSPSAAGDIQPGTLQPGFSFESTTDPSTLTSGDFDIVAIDTMQGPIDIGDAHAVPEPSTLMLVGTALLGLGTIKRKLFL